MVSVSLFEVSVRGFIISVGLVQLSAKTFASSYAFFKVSVSVFEVSVRPFKPSATGGNAEKPISSALLSNRPTPSYG